MSTPTTISQAALKKNIQEIQRTGIAMLFLLVSSVAVRMYVRIRMIKKFDPADWAMVATFLVSTAHIIMSITNCSLAIEILFDGKGNLLDLYNNLFRATGATYIATLIFLKISLGYFFLHIFSHQRPFRIAIYAMMIVSTLLGVIYLPIGNFTCAEFKVFPGIVNVCPKGVQRSASVLFVMFSVVNIVTDFILTGMACSALWKAKLPTPTKISALVLLCFGSLGGIASSVRLGIFLTPANIATYSQQTLALIRWILIELGFSVIAANLAMTRPLFHAFLVRMGVITQIGTTHGTTPGAASATRRTQKTNMDGDEMLLNDDIQKTVTVVVSGAKGSVGSDNDRSVVEVHHV